jgi:hypothetical protein
MNPNPQPHSPNFPTVEITVEASEPPNRNREPVSCGIPIPKGMLRNDLRYLMLFEEGYKSVPVQTRVLDFWPDGSIRWLLLDWQATVKGSARCRLQLTDTQPAMATAGAMRVQEEKKTIRGKTLPVGTIVETGHAKFQIKKGLEFLFDAVQVGGSQSTRPVVTILKTELDRGIAHSPQNFDIQLGELGLIKCCVRVKGGIYRLFPIPTAFLEAYLFFYSKSATVRILMTVKNRKSAKHPGGLWSLGETRSVLLKDHSFSLKWSEFNTRIEQLEEEKKSVTTGRHFKKLIQLNVEMERLFCMVGDMTREWAARGQFSCSPESHVPLAACEELFQSSSGGPNWQSSNHVNRHGKVENSSCGYRVRSGDQEQTGQRATPIVTLERDGQTIGMAMRYFWQNFPKAIEAGPNSLTLRLFPRQHGDLHELQAGEQKTHEFVVAFGKDEVTPDEPLAWVRSPARVRVDPASYAASGAIPYLTPESEDPNADYIKLVRAAIEGDDTFEKKREVIDEYGWRDFGDIYADHEAVNHTGPQPLVSHYNNQYDPLAGFAIQFMRTGDYRWWDAMNELAAHVVDIDIYHTDQDKAAYNHGLFWHTVHYTDAGLSTHRSYPRAPGVGGGGPGNEHNYTTGLMLHYFLTGNPQSREAAIGLAQWVIDMDDGKKTIFRWLDRGNTGLASATVSPGYHGPGRGAGNSINALLDGHRLATGSGDPRRAQIFLDKAEQLIRRCIHPSDNIAERNLLDAEKRWSYTVFLQALGKYLDYKAERDELDWMYAYGRAALLQYARWMAANEYPFLEKPEILEYPTETWVAQDMRKSEVFKFAAKYAERNEERARFLERSEFFFRYVTTTLMGMKTRTLARPVVILLSNGFTHAYFQRHPDVAAPLPRVIPSDFGKPQVFVPQKVRAKKRLVGICIGLAVIALAIFLRGVF